MKHSGVLVLVCGLLLASCGKASEPEPDDTLVPRLISTCEELLTGDSVASDMLVGLDATADEFCTCYANREFSRDKTPDNGWTKEILSIMQAVIDKKTDEGLESSTAILAVKRAIDEDEEAYPFTNYNVDRIGETVRNATEAYDNGECAS